MPGHNHDMGDVAVSLETPADYSLRRTVSALSCGLRDPVLQIDQQETAWGLQTPEGAVTVRAEQQSEQLRVLVAGSGSSWLEPHLSHLFGLQDDPSVFVPDGPLKRLAGRHTGIHLVRMPVLFHRLVQIVLHQLVTWEEAASGWRTMTLRYGEAAPGQTELKIGPTPAKLKSLAYYDLVACGILPRQARLILRLAADARRIDKVWQQGDDALLQYLAAIPGIGDWTLETLRGTALGDADVVVTGDYGLPHVVSWVLQRQPRSDDAEMLQLLEPYRGHRYRVLRLLMQSGIQPPRRGPKMPLRPWMK